MTIRADSFRNLKNSARLALCLSLLAQGMLLTGVQPVAAQKRKIGGAKSLSGLPPVQTGTPPAQTGEDVQSTHVSPSSVTVVNFDELAKMVAKQKKSGVRNVQAETYQVMPAPGSIQDTPPGQSESLPPSAPVDTVPQPLVASPAPATTFLAQEDGPKVGTSTFTIPPDTQGAVGIDKVFTNTNSNYRIHDKTTGAPLSTVSSDTFWASSGGSGFFDPRIVFDPYNQRWILAMDSNPGTANSSIEIAISQTSDPSGSYFIYRFVVGCANGAVGCTSGGEWADFPMLGFNKNWIAVTMNMFTITTSVNNNFKALVLDYPQARAGTPVGTLFSGAGIGFCNHPAETYDPNQNTLFLALHLSSGGATYKLSTITGTSSAPVFTIGATQTRPGGGWTQPTGDILPQQCVGVPGTTCPTTLRRIDVTDAQIRGDVVYRNGFVYYPQIIQLPAGGTVASSHVAVQWTKLNSSKPIGVVDPTMFADGGRIEDPTATFTNGGKHYAFPSVAVNKNDDMMVGFSQFASNQFASAGYAVRLHGDAAGTTRDPNIYKAGEDYYSKTFSDTRNRWGDYSATRLDPVNERDMWAVQEYAGLRTPPDANTTTNASRWSTYWAKVALPAGPNDLKISEFRLRGPNGANDEFIEVYNNNLAPLTVTTTDGSAGYAVAASDGVIRCTIPVNTVIPGRGHYLCTNSVGYSLSSYPAGNNGVSATTATGDATYATDIPDNAGIALFNTATVANFSTATRLDAVGSTSEANTLYKEGAGYPAINPTFNIEYSFYRNLITGLPQDTDDNAADFFFVDTNGTSAGAGQHLGAPGPENLSSPVLRTSQFKSSLIDPSVSASSPPNRVVDPTSDIPNNSTFGTLDIRRTFTNNTGGAVTRLRFRIVDITTFFSPVGTADLRARTSTLVVVVATTVQGTTLEQPPSQPNGGAFNSTLSADTVTLATPLAPGASISVRFLSGIQQHGSYRFFIIIEALP